MCKAEEIFLSQCESMKCTFADCCGYRKPVCVVFLPDGALDSKLYAVGGGLVSGDIEMMSLSPLPVFC